MMGHIMKTKTTILIIAAFSALFVVMTLLNIYRHTGKDYTVIYFPEFEVCYLYDDAYQIDLVQNGFKYKVGSNSGVVSLREGPLSEGYRWAGETLGEFQAKYMKNKNDRIVEYKLSEKMHLRDDFHYIKSGGLNLVLYKKECSIFLKKYSKKQEIRFNQVI